MRTKLLVICTLVVVCTQFLLDRRSGEELSLPTCKLSQLVETPIHFFTDGSISETRLQQLIDYSNLVLANSCVPMNRTLSGITKLDMSQFKSSDEGALHKQLVAIVSPEVLKPMQRKGSYYVLVLPKEHQFFQDGTSGVAHVNFSQSFAIISSDIDKHVLEHELGHLAWAWHNDTPEHWMKGQIFVEHHHFLKPYARGALCRDAGTVMTYSENQLPVYSSPKIKYYGKPCGDEESADNVRLMREFAATLIAQPF